MEDRTGEADPSSAPAGAPPAPAEVAAATAGPAAKVSPAAPRSDQVVAAPPSAPDPYSDAEPSLTGPPPEGFRIRTLADDWREAVEAVRTGSPRLAKSLAFGRLVGLSPGEVALDFPPDAGFHRVTVTGSGKPTIEKALSDHFRRPTRLVERSGKMLVESLAEADAQSQKARERVIESKVREHPAVRSALRILGGELEHVQVLDEVRSTASGEPPDEG